MMARHTATALPHIDADLGVLLAQYRRTGKAITVNFRDLVPQHNNPDRSSHLIHSYPAKVISHIPAFCLASARLSSPHNSVLDPFCGTGTVLVEAILAGRNALGVDANPLARLIAKVKSTPIDPAVLSRAVRNILGRIRTEPDGPPPSVVNLSYWFYPHVIRDLTCIREAIQTTRNDDIRDFFWICFSQSLRKVSLADLRLSVPVRLRADKYPKGHLLRARASERLSSLRYIRTFKVFEQVVVRNALRMHNLALEVAPNVTSRIIGSDARNLRHDFATPGAGRRVPTDSVDLIVTSPPYAGAQKYIRSSSLSLGWLDLCAPEDMRSLEGTLIGRERFAVPEYDEGCETGVPGADRAIGLIYRVNPLRAHIAATYLCEMRTALVESARVLRRGGHLVLVIANNTVCGREFHTASYISHLAQEAGLTLRLSLIDHIRSRGLMTKRNHSAGVISREWVLLLRKPA
jgi:DNA modification methylase